MFYARFMDKPSTLPQPTTTRGFRTPRERDAAIHEHRQQGHHAYAVLRDQVISDLGPGFLVDVDGRVTATAERIAIRRLASAIGHGCTETKAARIYRRRGRQAAAAAVP